MKKTYCHQNVSSIVWSTADSDPGITECAVPIMPFSIRSAAPGWVNSIFVKNTSNHARYLNKSKTCCDLLYIS